MDEYDYIGFFEGEKYVCSCREQKLAETEILLGFCVGWKCGLKERKLNESGFVFAVFGS